MYHRLMSTTVKYLGVNQVRDCLAMLYSICLTLDQGPGIIIDAVTPGDQLINIVGNFFSFAICFLFGYPLFVLY